MRADRTTLAEFLAQDRGRGPGASAELDALILDVALACRGIAGALARGALAGAAADDILLRADEAGARLGGILSERMLAPYPIPEHRANGKYLLVVDPLDAAANVEINRSAGTVFGVLPAPGSATAGGDDFLQPGSAQVGAGYAIYGPSTVLVLSLGAGVHAFTLDPRLGEFVLTRADLAVPAAGSEFAVNASDSRFWDPAVKRYVSECLAGKTGARAKDFDMRWTGSLVAEAHRVLLRGGVCLYPRDTRPPIVSGPRRLLCNVNPIAFLVEQAGGRASTGRARVLDVAPGALQQPLGLFFGAREEVERIEQYHLDHNLSAYDAPLFGIRGLFRASI